MAMGTSKQVSSLSELLHVADFVTCHVPELPETINMIGRSELEQMKHGSYLINASRGTVVDIPALVDAMRSGRIAGAALDVYPAEPGGNGDYFTNDLNPWAEDLRSLKNIILTPHIGGSTEEAQSAIGIEVGQALVSYVNEGSTVGAVNMPEVNLRSPALDDPNHARVIYIHRNIPGVLRRGKFCSYHSHRHQLTRTVNEILGDHNVDKQMTDSRGEVSAAACSRIDRFSDHSTGRVSYGRHQQRDLLCHQRLVSKIRRPWLYVPNVRGQSIHCTMLTHTSSNQNQSPVLNARCFCYLSGWGKGQGLNTSNGVSNMQGVLHKRQRETSCCFACFGCCGLGGRQAV